MRLVHVKTSGLTTLHGENAVSPDKKLRTNNVMGENAVSPAENHWTNNDTGRKCG